nr:immunoglobulin light chain junction region [Macaca mulatta]
DYYCCSYTITSTFMF